MYIYVLLCVLNKDQTINKYNTIIQEKQQTRHMNNLTKQ